MNEPRSIKNRAELAQQGRIASCLEWIICSLGVDESAFVEWIADNHLAAQKARWLVASDTDGRGFAMRVDDLDQFSTSIRRWVEYARCAQKLAQLFTRDESNSVLIFQRDAPPSEWHGVQVRVRERLIRCAVSPEFPRLTEHVGVSLKSLGAVRVSLIGSVLVSVAISPGWEHSTRSIRVMAPGIKWSGRLCVADNSEVYLEQDMSEETVCGESGIPVCIELGEIELDISDIASMRRGSVIEVDAPGQLRCFMRVGNSIIAEGSVESRNEGFSVRIERFLRPQ